VSELRARFKTFTHREKEVMAWVTGGLLNKQVAAELGVTRSPQVVFDVIADRGYFSGEEILECDKDGITVTLPKPMSRCKGRRAFLANKTSAM
jgi:hypothetical protein